MLRDRQIVLPSIARVADGVILAPWGHRRPYFAGSGMVCESEIAALFMAAQSSSAHSLPA
jgi:hypothetical protein